MKALVNTAPGQLQWMDWPTPEPGPGQVRIRSGACGICATDCLLLVRLAEGGAVHLQPSRGSDSIVRDEAAATHRLGRSLALPE